MDEINDYLDVIDIKIDRLNKTLERLEACVIIINTRIFRNKEQKRKDSLKMENEI